MIMFNEIIIAKMLNGPKYIMDSQDDFKFLKLDSMGPAGNTSATYNDEPIAVFGGIPEEEVIAQIFRVQTKRQKNTSAIVTEVLKPSKHRVKPPCPYFGPCTGCQWQHIGYSFQLQLKQQNIENEFAKYSNLEDIHISKTMPCPLEFDYRNHARFTVRNNGELGFVNRITRKFIRVDSCMLMTPWINDALQFLQTKCKETTQLSIRYGINTGESIIQPKLHNSNIHLSSGQTHYQENVSGTSFRIGSPSFFQVNTVQAEKLINLVRERIVLTGKELIIDAYAGVGTYSVLLAPFVKKVIAIEESKAAIKDASVNAIGIDNIEFVAGKTEDIFETLEESPDAVILNPPRVGCHPETLESIVRRQTNKIIYISCNPETLARDLHLLVKRGFNITNIEPVDMFPQTHHIECVATLII